MSLPAGVTAYPVVGRRPPAVAWWGLVGSLVPPLLVGTYGVAAFGAPVSTMLLVGAVCWALPPLVSLLRLPLVVAIAVVLGGGFGLVVLLTEPGYVAYAGILMLFVATGAGMTPLTAVRHRRWAARRLEGVEGEPPSGRDPSNGRDVGMMATWRDADRHYEAVDPSVDLVLDAVRALDGGYRSVVSVFRGKGRLDVAGDARGQMVVMQSDDRARWQAVVRPGGTDSTVALVVAGQRATYPETQVTDLVSAERAVRTWVDRGERDPSLDWAGGSLLTPVFRPQNLKLTD